MLQFTEVGHGKWKLVHDEAKKKLAVILVLVLLLSNFIVLMQWEKQYFSVTTWGAVSKVGLKDSDCFRPPNDQLCVTSVL